MRVIFFFFFFSSRRRHTRFDCDWSSDVCSSDLTYARAPAHPVDEPDPECLKRAARPDGLVWVVGRVNMSVGVQTLVRVDVYVEESPTPADEQPERETDDQETDGGLGTLLGPLRQVRLEEDDRNAEEEEAGRVAGAPGRAESCGGLRRALLGSGDQRRDSGEVVRVGRMAEPEN